MQFYVKIRGESKGIWVRGHKKAHIKATRIKMRRIRPINLWRGMRLLFYQHPATRSGSRRL